MTASGRSVATDLTRRRGHELATALRAGEVTSRELTAAHLDNAQRQNHALNAWLALDPDDALRQADAADTRLRAARTEGPAAMDSLHPLLGLPVALKEEDGIMIFSGSAVVDW